ncbi:unnamed protein product, partial [marine sediment metagenome]
HGLAWIYSKIDDHKNAIYYYKKMSELKQGYQTGYDGLGYAYFELKEYKKAIDCFNKLAPGYKRYYTVRLKTADSYKKLNNIKKAEKIYLNLISSYPKWSGAYNNLAYMYADKNINFEKGLEHVDRAIDLTIKYRYKKSNLCNYYDTKGWLYYKLKDYRSAKKWLEKSLKIKYKKTHQEHLNEIIKHL